MSSASGKSVFRICRCRAPSSHTARCILVSILLRLVPANAGRVAADDVRRKAGEGPTPSPVQLFRLLGLRGRRNNSSGELSDLLYQKSRARSQLLDMRDRADRVARFALIFLDRAAGRDYAEGAVFSLEQQARIVGLFCLTKVPHRDVGHQNLIAHQITDLREPVFARRSRVNWADDGASFGFFHLAGCILPLAK